MGHPNLVYLVIPFHPLHVFVKSLANHINYGIFQHLFSQVSRFPPSDDKSNIDYKIIIDLKW
jgi:hypothetical protein